ncbi:transcriptional regulator, LysR family [Bradyrhizobium sp. Ghvi]|uniref:LysR family transcriptional regulator n=1 Tax=Bradyrhizobium sp. Ghvi TaxID=1855319 RepID=UPI0008E2428C|nr:LysR family transcriptional regulator [Bradyrhizobium sp. Ghvi]SFP76432.1 transcriptional regulator, LysR family [Bradyrhizobium sp. Ghvi]
MDERQLKCFLVISESGSVTGAAERLDIAQPSLSQMLLRLEEELGSKLFQRTSRGVVLTEAGQVFREHARNIISDIERARDEIKAEDSYVRSEVTIGLPSSFATLIGAPLIAAAAQETPRVQLRLIEAMSGHIREWLTKGDLDVGVLYGIQDSRHLLLEQVAVEELFLVGPPNAFKHCDRHGFADDAVDLSAVDAFPLIVPTGQHGLRRFVDERARSSQLKLNIQHEINSLTVIKNLVQSGHGYTLLAHAAISEELKRGELSAARIVKPVFRRGIFLARNPSQFVTRASVKAAETLTSIAWDLISRGDWLATRVKRSRMSGPDDNFMRSSPRLIQANKEFSLAQAAK